MKSHGRWFTSGLVWLLSAGIACGLLLPNVSHTVHSRRRYSPKAFGPSIDGHPGDPRPTYTGQDRGEGV
jgi:hypothetical protein